MSITKESKEWTQAQALVPGKWSLNHCVRCMAVPDITPDLLYAILEAGQKRKAAFLYDVTDWLLMGGNTLADAIIRAAASLQEAK